MPPAAAARRAHNARRASTSSPRSSTTTAPAWRNAARPSSKSPSTRPVWDRAKALTSERPTFSATTGLTAASSAIAATRPRPSSTPSSWTPTARVASSAARNPNMSANPTSAAFPSPTPSRTPSPSAAAAKQAARLTPPLDATMATGPGSSVVTSGTKLGSTPSSGFMNPDVLGPSSRIPCRRATASASSCNDRPACASRSPAGSASPDRTAAWRSASANPPAHTMAARTPARPHSSNAVGTASARMTSTARSTGRPIAATDRTAARPSISPARGLTRCSRPRNPDNDRTMALPALPWVAEAPITAMLDGRSRASNPAPPVTARGSHEF